MLEVALWSAVRALEEQAVLAQRIVERARKAKNNRAVSMFEKRALDSEQHSSVIRQRLPSIRQDDKGEPVLQGDD
jgi:hypothetical protein